MIFIIILDQLNILSENCPDLDIYDGVVGDDEIGGLQSDALNE